MIPLGIALTVMFSLAVLALPRVYAALGVMAGVCYITQGQVYNVAGFHMNAIRIISLVGMVRIVMRGELRDIKFNKIDWAMTAYIVAVNLIPVLREKTSDELVYRLGCTYDILLSYWLFRGLLRDWLDVEQFFYGLAFLIVPMTMEMVFEFFMHRSLYEPFGGIGDLTIREGRPRCQGAFRIGITAGVFGATLIPPFIALFRSKGRALGATIGLVCALIITWTSNSSGPLMAALSSAVAWMFWPMRGQMQTVRRGIVALLVGLHLSMKVPIWYIFSKLGCLTGGDGWHRSYLIDRYIHYFWDWWLMGTNNTHDWMPYVLADGNADITDLYVAAGINGGLAALVFLILVLVRCFRYLGLALNDARDHVPEAEMILWGLGGALFSHVVTLFSITYWDQVYVVLWSLMAMIASVTSNLAPAEASVEIPEELPEAETAFGFSSDLPDGEARPG